MSALASSHPPEQGQLVSVRQRQFVVTDVVRSALPERYVSSGPGDGAQAQHLVSLSSVEDDSYNDELQVVWELEPGAIAYQQSSLPAPLSAAAFDQPAQLDAFLDAVRWGAIASADTRRLQAPFRSGIEIEEYQLDPVARAIAMPRVGLLMADDVGLGKTIEAGLVALELILRHRARRMLVVCPATLQLQWRDQMRDKFGLEFRIVDSALLHELRRTRGIHANPWSHFPRLITSIDYLKRPRPLRLLRETLPRDGEARYPRRYDLLIVDEAQNVAPSGRQAYATDSLRTEAIRLLAPHVEHKLFLSATPHNGYSESFTALLELLDDQRFARGVPPDPDQLRAVVVRRLKSDITDAQGNPRFPRRVLLTLEIPFTDEERAMHAALQQYSALRRGRAQQGATRTATEFVVKLLKKRLFSSPAAFARTLERHLASLNRPRSGARLPALAAVDDWLDEDFDGYDDDEEFDQAHDGALEALGGVFEPPSAEERALLDRLHSWATVAAGRPDTKAVELLRWLERELRPAGVWNDRRVIIFTEYRDTQRWLQGLLAARGFGGDRLLTLFGGMPPDEREKIKAAFQDRPERAAVRILLATDAASEGIDLQNYCSRLIHYEIPWNPSRLEQRNGRIDRHGQRASEVQIYHPVAAGFALQMRGTAAPTRDLAADLEFLMRAAQKVEAIREDLGKVGPVIAQQVEEAMLGGRSRLDTAAAETQSAPARRLLRVEQDLRRRLAELRDQLFETRDELRISPANVQAVVEMALTLAGQPPLRPAVFPGLWPDPAGEREHCPVFMLPPFSGSWAPCNEGLAHPHTQAIRPAVFDSALLTPDRRNDLVLLHLNHRLVQMCLRLLRAEVWQPLGRQRISRVTARLATPGALAEPVVVAHGRIVVLGSDGQRLHEELIEAACVLRGRFPRLNVGETRAALAAATDSPVPEAARTALAEQWPALSEPLFRALNARMEERTRTLAGRFAERAEQEIRDVTAVLNELRAGIARELGLDQRPRQLELIGLERDQFERDLVALQRRHDAIPAELERETAALRRRYAGPEAHLFPLAVTFVVPG